MVGTATLETLASEVRARLDALSTSLEDRLSDRVLDEKVRGLLEGMEDASDARKLRFPGSAPELAGTRYARLGLTAGDVEFLYDLQVGLRGQRRVDGAGVYEGPSEGLTTVALAIQSGERVAPSTARDRDLGRLAELLRTGALSPSGYEAAVRAMDTAESGFGLQLIGAQYVSELWRGARAASRVFSLLNTFEMSAPVAFLPTEADLPEVMFVGESTANNSPNYQTAKTGSNRVQVDARKLLMHQMWSGEMEEDSIVPFLPFLREQAARSWAHTMDGLVLNGDMTVAATGNINSDDGTPAATRHYLAFDGIRHAAIVDNVANFSDVAGAVTLTLFKNFRGRMLAPLYKHAWGHPNDPDDVVHVCDPETADAIAFLDEFLTNDKAGAGATIFTGSQGRVAGNAVIPSIDVSKTEADGKVSVTPANNVRGQIVTFNRRGCVVGVRRELQIETERLPATDQTRIVYSTRSGFGRFSPTGAASAVEWAHVYANISL